MDPGGLHRGQRDIVEGVVPGLLAGQDGDAAMVALGNHEAVVAVELLDIGRVDAQAVLETFEEGDRLAAVGDGIQVPGKVTLVLQFGPAGLGVGGVVQESAFIWNRQAWGLQQKACQPLEAPFPGPGGAGKSLRSHKLPLFDTSVIARCHPPIPGPYLRRRRVDGLHRTHRRRLRRPCLCSTIGAFSTDRPSR